MPFRTPESSYVELTHSTTIRALAHPARIAILAYLDDGPATATECSETVGQSPSACSYHLRTLAELGFVEEAESNDARKRMWRLKVRGHGIPKRSQETPEIQAAARLWGQQWVSIEQRLLADYLDRETAEPPAWRQATTFASEEVHLTPEELITVGEEMMALLVPYLDRSEPNRPEDSRPVHIALTGFPRLEPAERRLRARTVEHPPDP